MVSGLSDGCLVSAVFYLSRNTPCMIVSLVCLYFSYYRLREVYGRQGLLPCLHIITYVQRGNISRTAVASKKRQVPYLSFFTGNGHYAFIASMATACLVEVAGTVVVLRLLHASTRAWKRRALTGSVVYVSSG